MEQRAKERLTGAAILVALLVLLVPELLPGPRLQPPAPAAASEAALRSYTVELDHPAAGSPLAASAVPAPPPDSAPDASPGSAPAADAPTPASAAASGPAPSPAPPVPAPPVARAGQPQPPAPRSTSAPDAAVARSPASAAAGGGVPGRVRHPAVKSGGRWSVQLGVFAERSHALALARRLKSAGFAPTVSAAGQGGHLRFRVRVGSEYDRAGARALQARLAAAGQRGEIVAPP